MPTLRLRNMPADPCEVLAYRAERERRGIDQQVLGERRHAQALGAPQRRRQAVARIREQLALAPRVRRLRPTSEALIREGRERSADDSCRRAALTRAEQKKKPSHHAPQPILKQWSIPHWLW